MLNKIISIIESDGYINLFIRIVEKIIRILKNQLNEIIARLFGSYSKTEKHNNKLVPLIDLKENYLFNKFCIPEEVAELYLDHKFDLLGSGWVQISYGMECRGIIGVKYHNTFCAETDHQGTWLSLIVNKSNLNNSREIWKKIDIGYKPIDWQIDFKSGYRWSSKKWSKNINFGHLPSVDIKTPWELGRMQHLPQMALLAVAIGKNKTKTNRIIREVRNQILDFIATNPPGFGVNWVSPMEIAIRAVNLCIAWDILRAGGFNISEEDETILAKSLYDHGYYIINNLEWTSERGNHYLANLCGLIFIASYLKDSIETDQWLSFSIEQLQEETIRQFLPDGGNFEGSTAYHRFSCEMVLYATTIITSIPESRLEKIKKIRNIDYKYLPYSAHKKNDFFSKKINNEKTITKKTILSNEFLERLRLAITFLSDVMRSDYNFPQIGDNDSGRFLKLEPVYETLTVSEAKSKFLNLAEYSEMADDKTYFIENICNGKHILNVAQGISLIQNYEDGKNSIEKFIVKCYKPKIILQTKNTKYVKLNKYEFKVINKFEKLLNNNENVLIKKYKISLDLFSKNHELKYYNYNHFGLHIWKSSKIHIVIRSIESKKINVKSHFHDDQLCIDLTINKINLIRDPGTFLYTPSNILRNKYRSREAHFPTIQKSKIPLEPFKKLKIVPVKCIYAGINGYVGKMECMGIKDFLVLKITKNQIQISMLSKHKNKNLGKKGLSDYGKVNFSPSYGVIEY